ncbi:MAG: tRNA (adenosine(37)-N6)-threonylcarbamoyltransferase complex dimerization subunit type 1 TsaB [Desulfobacula sp.]|uniref:tRNA (adenosine(37)-N6)-threonylcarbamoyltransferase complex dimerization subunit type 1 TsaB n=1 Tax=Desulfobacula sp. TaxID=2593537 RepID=UPI0025C38C1E|nr:tRNA (adenosine(37)-N6)-threonylcarbamoyltransferase complex dimerization subunit type 1 TsaB [Desulfobacula sp.]MCD4718323.1 tRNA (adenosine(37)-N6)-threonylcarbamoyltransferase complex dimerization subunit type 1 TsaB [Desulfobacula sp.]
MKLLCLSTAEPGCSLAIIDGDSLVCEEFWEARLTHSKRLVKMIEHMLEKRACMELFDIDAFVAARGPGSFTGLRIGISVVKGLAYAMEKPVMGVSSLDGIAFRFVHSSIPVCVMMDAKRNEVYCAVYQFDHGRLVSKTRERVVSPEDAIEMTNGATLFAGSGSKVFKDIIEHKADNPTLAHDFLDSISATALVQSLYLKENFLNEPENILTPSYLRQSDAQLQFAKK